MKFVVMIVSSKKIKQNLTWNVDFDLRIDVKGPV